MPINPRQPFRALDIDVLGWDLGREGSGVDGVEVQEHVDEEEDDEGEAVEDEDVGDVRDVRRGDEGHLLFVGAEEEEAGGVEELFCGGLVDGGLEEGGDGIEGVSGEDNGVKEGDLRMVECIGSCLRRRLRRLCARRGAQMRSQ
jgi:hypothetical protein